AKPLFWRESSVEHGLAASSSERAQEQALAAKLVRSAREVEPVVRVAATFVEKVRNAMTFADGPASVVCFFVLGLVALALSCSLLLISLIDPGYSFVSGVYGAVAIVALARPSDSGHGSEDIAAAEARAQQPLQFQGLVNRVLSSVPDQAELAHRFVAAQVQKQQNGQGQV
ncbi:unnamed protein product, partial [Polarella glacialis]